MDFHSPPRDRQPASSLEYETAPPEEEDGRGDGENVAQVGPLTNAELKQLAAKHRPPAEWFEGDEEGTF